MSKEHIERRHEIAMDEVRETLIRLQDTTLDPYQEEIAELHEKIALLTAVADAAREFTEAPCVGWTQRYMSLCAAVEALDNERAHHFPGAREMVAALDRIREIILHEHEPLTVNDVLEIIDENDPRHIAHPVDADATALPRDVCFRLVRWADSPTPRPDGEYQAILRDAREALDAMEAKP